jgi:uncharacterized protein YdeI (BOF family)
MTTSTAITPASGLHRLSKLVTGVSVGVLLMPTMVLADETRAKADPYSMEDETWITIQGTVESVSRDEFRLDYGDDSIVVEMDDSDRDATAYELSKGDEVSVSGRIDDDFFASTSIEAAAVYVKDLGTTFFASSTDDEDRSALAPDVTSPLPVEHTVISGRVTNVSENEFEVDTGTRMVRVETDKMTYNPMDDEGYQHIDVGDRVRVSGEIDFDFFEGRELVADSIIELYDSPFSG